MGMLHSSSGKSHFDLYHEPTNYSIPKDVLKKILIFEDAARASAQYQAKYTEQDSLQWFRDVTREIQIAALIQNGIPAADVNQALVVLNNARFEFKDDPEMNQLTVYMRLDRSRRGDLRMGDKMPNASLVGDDGMTVMLADLEAKSAANGKALALIAGSAS